MINNTSDLISIIIPVYNAEQTLAKCLDSILSQTYSHIEIIIINDGSTDSTQSIIDNFATKDSRIKSFYQNNSGNSSARNLGIKNSSSSLLTFIDADDWIEKDTLELLFYNLQKYNADISICGYYKDFFQKTEKEFQDENPCIYNRKEALEKILYDSEIKSYPWAKLYKKNLFNGLEFPLGRIYEDYAFIYLVINNANKIIKSNIAKYHYVQYKNSLSNSTTAMKEFHLLLGAFERFDFALNNKDIISDWKHYNNFNAKIFFALTKSIIRLRKKDEMKEEFSYVLKRIKHFIKTNSCGVKFYYLLKLKTLILIPHLYSIFLIATKKKKRKKEILH